MMGWADLIPSSNERQRILMFIRRYFFSRSLKIIEQPAISYDPSSGDVIFEAIYLKSGSNLPIYIECFAAGNVPMFDMPTFNVLEGNLRQMWPRFKVETIKNYMTGEKLSIPIANVAPSDGQLIHWKSGDENHVMSTNSASYMCNILLAEADGKIARYPFMFISRTMRNFEGNKLKQEVNRPLVVGPGLMNELMKL